MSSLYEQCRLCARDCGARRTVGERGYCCSDDKMNIARADLHFWEEPVISGERGSGTVFFTGCSLGCIFCQNRLISRADDGVKDRHLTVTDSELAEIMMRLEEKGAHNVNFVTPTHFVPGIISAVELARTLGLHIPIVYNTGSYERVETVDMLKDTVDVYLADYKFHRNTTAARLANAPDYPEVARAAIERMVLKRPRPVIENGLMKSGVIIRLLLLPGHLGEAKLGLKYLYETYGDSVYFSLMNQYTVMPDMTPPLNRTVTDSEYSELIEYALKKGVKNAFIQEGGTAKESFIPDFDLTGVKKVKA